MLTTFGYFLTMDDMIAQDISQCVVHKIGPFYYIWALFSSADISQPGPHSTNYTKNAANKVFYAHITLDNSQFS